MSTESTDGKMDTNLATAQNRASNQDTGDREAMQTPLPIPTQRKRKRLGCMLTGIIVGLFLLVGLFNLCEPFTVLAIYAANPIPCVGNLRTKIELFKLDHNWLPGLGHTSEGITNGTSQLAEGLARLQTFSGRELAAWSTDFSSVIVVTNGNHFAPSINCSISDLTGHPLHPEQVQYRVDACESNNYVYAIGVFGDGNGLKAGTGYAVLELVSADAGIKHVCLWERYQPVAKRPKQIVMVNAEEARKVFKCESPEQARKMNLCWVGDTEALMSGAPARVKKALDDLRIAGWRIH